MSITQYTGRIAIVLAAFLSAASANATLTTRIDAPTASAEVQQKGLDLLAKKGADDRPGHKRRGRGRDDGPNHAFLLKLDDIQLARRGADDRPGHIRRGRGADDATGTHRHGRGADDSTGHGRRGRGADDAPGDDHGGRRV